MKPFKAEVKFDNCTLNEPFALLSIGNGFSTGGGFLLTPEARVNDGLLDICFIRQASRRRTLNLLPQAIKGQHLKQPEVVLQQSKIIEIKSDEILPIYCDGELPVLKDPHNFKIELIPESINFIIG